MKPKFSSTRLLSLLTLSLLLLSSNSEAQTERCTLFEGQKPTTDGLVIDQKRGLTWKACVEGVAWKNGSCIGDLQSNRIQPDWAGAIEYAAQAQSHGLRWRLPTAEELRGILDPSPSCYFGSITGGVIGRTQEFSRGGHTAGRCIWTSTKHSETHVLCMDPTLNTERSIPKTPRGTRASSDGLNYFTNDGHILLVHSKTQSADTLSPSPEEVRESAGKLACKDVYPGAVRVISLDDYDFDVVITGVSIQLQTASAKVTSGYKGRSHSRVGTHIEQPCIAYSRKNR